MKPPAVIVDVDGTLVDVSGVRHYVLDDPRRKDFHHFHLGAMFCPPIASTVELVENLHPHATVFVVTARKEQWRLTTRHWLEKHSVPHDHLLMRANDDNRRDVEVKADILTRIRATHDVLIAIDDNPAVLALWRAEGIPTVVVPGWDDTTTN